MDRFTISIDDQLSNDFSHWIAERQYENRSEAVRDLIRVELGRIRVKHKPGDQCIACLSYVFNHHERDLSERLTSIQHSYHDLVVSTMHVHLDHDLCMETTILRGKAKLVQAFSDKICAERGVQQGKINLITVDLHLPHPSGNQKKWTAKSEVPHVHVHVKPEK